MESSSDPKHLHPSTQATDPKARVRIAERLLSWFEWLGWLTRVAFAGAGIALVLGVVSRPLGVRIVLVAVAILLCTQVATRILKSVVMAVVQRDVRAPRSAG